MLVVSYISKSFRTKKVLDDISFAIKPGTLNGIIGENGTGKTTLLKIITGEISADKGSVQIKARMGYSPQELIIFPMLTVEENFMYFAAAYGMKDKDAWRKRMNMLLQQFGFKEYAFHRVNSLSGGTKQKLNLSLALLHDPDILILDEPYGGFDHDTFQHFWDYTLQLRSEGKSILLVTHLLNNLEIFDEVFELKKGKIA
jgi:ABC-type multidrug transport system ATPase subunit